MKIRKIKINIEIYNRLKSLFNNLMHRFPKRKREISLYFEINQQNKSLRSNWQ